MDNPEILATPGTQDTGRKKTLENTEGAIKNGQSEPLATPVHKTQDENKR